MNLLKTNIFWENIFKKLKKPREFCVRKFKDFGQDSKESYRSPTKIPNRDKKTESPYLVHPLTYRQVYLTKDAYFVEKIHCELLVCLKITHLTWIWNSYLFNFCMNFPPCIQAFFLFYASWQEIRILVLFGWGKNARCSVVLLSIRFFRPATVDSYEIFLKSLGMF